MVFWKAGLVMLAVPKTGTHAYEAALRDRADVVLAHPPHLKHMGARGFRKKIRPLVDPQKDIQFKIMAVIREPVSWLGSWYRYRSRPYLDGSERSTKEMSFERFVEGALADTPPAFADVGRPSRMVSNLQGDIIADYLFAYEDPAPLTAFLQKNLGSVIVTERQNTSPKAPLALSAELDQALRDKWADEFRLYDAVTKGVFLPLP